MWTEKAYNIPIRIDTICKRGTNMGKIYDNYGNIVGNVNPDGSIYRGQERVGRVGIRGIYAGRYGNKHIGFVSWGILHIDGVSDSVGNVDFDGKIWTSSGECVGYAEKDKDGKFDMDLVCGAALLLLFHRYYEEADNIGALEYEGTDDSLFLSAPLPAPRAITENSKTARIYVYDAYGKEIGMITSDGKVYDGRLDKDNYLRIGVLADGMYFVGNNVPAGYIKNDDENIYEMDDVEMKEGHIQSYRPFLAGYMILKKIFNTRGEYLGYVKGERSSYDNVKVVGGAALLLLGDKDYIIRTVDKDKDHDDLLKIKNEVMRIEYGFLWKGLGLCTNCGGKIGGLFSKKCKDCGTKY